MEPAVDALADQVDDTPYLQAESFEDATTQPKRRVSMSMKIYEK